MTDRKWLRRALLGSVALGVASTGAQAADELPALKAQLEALQNRVNQLESAPLSPAALPDGVSLVTIKRGQGTLGDWNPGHAHDRAPTDRGFTVAITPTADVPAPITELTLSGFVKGDLIYDFDQDQGDSFNNAAGLTRSSDEEDIRLHARQSRFTIKSRSDTAIGQIRTLVEGHFWNTARTDNSFSLRHAAGEWDMTPNWTFRAGQTDRVGADVHTGVNTVDFGGSAGGAGGTRAAQVTLLYTTGPVTLGFGISEPRKKDVPARAISGTHTVGTGDTEQTYTAMLGEADDTPGAEPDARTMLGTNSPDFPNFAASLLYTVPGGHQFFIGGEVEHIEVDGGILTVTETGTPASGTAAPSTKPLAVNDTALGWEIQGGVNINLADIAKFTGHIQYGEGLITANGSPFVDTPFRIGGLAGTRKAKIVTHKSFGFLAGMSFNVTDTTALNVQYGLASGGCNANNCGASRYKTANTLHANIMWQPVPKMKLGWEAIYGWKTKTAGKKPNALRAQFGAWFYF